MVPIGHVFELPRIHCGTASLPFCMLRSMATEAILVSMWSIISEPIWTPLWSIFRKECPSILFTELLLPLLVVTSYSKPSKSPSTRPKSNIGVATRDCMNGPNSSSHHYTTPSSPGHTDSPLKRPVLHLIPMCYPTPFFTRTPIQLRLLISSMLSARSKICLPKVHDSMAFPSYVLT
ncbi:hypothetical protein VTN77DRAFT_4637 [Rasamsonia byssochlamydoides]|uniref:uncharacterized protein n=1 Tax=Rasamsonia byssochlamydoides TaxID=89139 RepID=UPI003744A8DC